MFHRSKNEEKTPMPELSAPRTANLRLPPTSSAPVAAPNIPAVPAGPTVADIAKTSTQSRIAVTPPVPASVAAALASIPDPVQTSAPATSSEEKPMAADEHSRPQNNPAATSSRPIDIPGGNASYQSQPARSNPSYSAPNTYATAPSAGPGHNKAPQGRRLVIGEGISLSGEIEACEYLVIEGTVEAALKGASVLQIAESGTFYGTVEIDEATVSGRFEGEMTVNGRLTITATGSVTGTITYKELAVEAGATLDGKINPLSGSKVSAKKSERVGKSKVAASRNDNIVDGVELPFSGNQATAAAS